MTLSTITKAVGYSRPCKLPKMKPSYYKTTLEALEAEKYDTKAQIGINEVIESLGDHRPC